MEGLKRIKGRVRGEGLACHNILARPLTVCHVSYVILKQLCAYLSIKKQLTFAVVLGIILLQVFIATHITLALPHQPLNIQIIA